MKMKYILAGLLIPIILLNGCTELPQEKGASSERNSPLEDVSSEERQPEGEEVLNESAAPQKGSPLDFSEIGQPVLISEQFSFTEGPLWDRTSEVLLFSDISGNTIYKLTLPDSIDILRTPSNNANGLAFDIKGQILAAEHGSRSVTRMLSDGTIENLVDNYMGKALNSPNDLVVRSDGTIYFTDPTFGLERRTQGVDFTGLYRLDAEETLVLEGEFDNAPNGVALSPDEKTLYLALTFANEILAFDVGIDGATSNQRKFATAQHPDGMAVDIAGNLYIAGREGVEVWTPDGIELGIIGLKHQPTNCAFGGTGGKILFITAREGLYRVDVPIPGF